MRTNKFQKKIILPVLLAFLPFLASSQDQEVVNEIFQNYSKYKETSLSERRITSSDIEPLLQKFKKDSTFTVQKVGESIQGRDLTLISLGSGETSVFLWSQMHGDESTATMAIFDLLNFFANESYSSEKAEILQNISLHFLPMLNPDGAELFQRRNALGIDVNRDALRLQSPEGQTLKRIRDSLEADFGFNLHDQSRYYNAEGTEKPATISFLAPAYDFGKSINEIRANSMKLIVAMNNVLQEEMTGQVARYNDDFEPRAFGDNIQKWGTSTILIESGGNYEDREKQEIRKMNFLAILSGIFAISDESYKNIAVEDYEKIPENDSQLFDLKLVGLQYDLLGNTYILDLGINHNENPVKTEKGYYLEGRIADQGDLSTNFGYKTVDLTGYKITPGAVYPETFKTVAELSKADFSALLRDGYSYIKVQDLPEKQNFLPFPFQVVENDFKVPTDLKPGVNPTFFLKKDDKLEYAVINGFLINLNDSEIEIENGLILK